MRHCAPKFLGLAMVLPVALCAQTSAYTPPLTVSVVNSSSVVSNDDAAKWTAAIARQVHEDLAPVWKIDANVVFESSPSPGAWVCTIVDSGAGTSASILGTHNVGPDGTPACMVNAQRNLDAHASISQALSHEILEMLVDPWMSNVTFSPAAGSPNAATVYLKEVCDPVAGYSYAIDDVTVADFVYPDFFRAGFPAPGAKYDRLGIATIALQPAAHSYMLVRYISTFGGITSLDTWSYIWGSYCIFGPC